MLHNQCRFHIGSPPHTWRIQHKLNSLARPRGITSTYVENTLLFCFLVNVNKDHLHIRGEYQRSAASFRCSLGSPPHTWRIRLAFLPALGKLGITSTYVENTAEIKPVEFSSQDHLHIRGEYLRAVTFSKMNGGSPPHTWRIRCIINDELACSRITSTYVENTPVKCHSALI